MREQVEYFGLRAVKGMTGYDWVILFSWGNRELESHTEQLEQSRQLLGRARSGSTGGSGSTGSNWQHW